MKRFLCAILCGLLFCTACFTPFPAAWASQALKEIVPLEQAPQSLPGQYHYLMACVDTWQANPKNLGNTDGVILVTLDTNAKRLLFTTFTREMLVKRPDGGIGRITYIAKNYGVDALCGIISTHFGVPVDKYILFSMDNVQTIIDAMGGVYITVTDAEANYLNRYRISRDSTTPSMDKGGTYLFGGHAAVIYMRIRKVGNEGDAGRTRRMRTVLSTLASKYADITLNQAVQILTAVTTNKCLTNLTLSDLMEAMEYALTLRGVEPEGIQMPPNEAMSPIVYAGMSTRQVDFELARQKLAEFMDSGFGVISP